MTEEQTYNFAMEGMKVLASCGKDICNSIDSVAKTSVSPINNMISAQQNVKLKLIENELRKAENLHAQKMMKLQNAHEEKMLQMRIEHEEFIISEQRKVIEKMIEAASAAYDKKINFINAQLSTLEATYSKERDLLAEHIKFLETERMKCIKDANQYAIISKDLGKLEESKSKLYTEYMIAKGNLTDAVKYLEIDKFFGTSLENTQNKLLINGAKL